MELFNEDEIHRIIEQFGFTKVLNWTIREYSDESVGFLGEHLTLIIDVGSETLKLFVKCLPRSDEWKANYLKELSFFRKEYIMLSKLFKNFKQGARQWRPNLLLIKDDIFVFEDVTQLGFRMPSNRDILMLDELKACVVTLADFHAQSLIYEENRSRQLNRSYRIWEEYSDYLKEPLRSKGWRNAGRNAVIDFLKIYSKQKSNPKFGKDVDRVITALFDEALSLMKPSTIYRNVVMHRDLWSNNIFLRRDSEGIIRALFVDYQTVIYCPPMLDMSTLIYLNTNRQFRDQHVTEILNLYHEVFSERLNSANLDANALLDRKSLEKCYEESIPFGITQAALVIPITVMDVATREFLFCNPQTSSRVNEVTRSAEFINLAKSDSHYHSRVIDLFDEIVDRYICPSVSYDLVDIP